jgi:large conductance mechanosensitive channel
MLKDFREFALRGNVIDLAVGVVIGAAFNKIVESFVADLLGGPLSLLTGRMSDLSGLYLNLSGQSYPSLTAAEAAHAPTINYGRFFTSVLDFVIVAFAIWMIVRLVNRLRREEDEAAAEAAANERACPFCTRMVPRRASRCPECTAEIEPLPAAGAA